MRRARVPGGPAYGTAAMVVLTALASVTNYGSNIVFGRLLSSASFGDLTALLALVVVLTVPAGAAQTIGAERIAALTAAGQHDRARYVLRHGLAHVGVISLAAGVVILAASPLISELLDLQALGAALALAPVLVTAFFIPVAWGLLQGFERFIALGALMFVSALARIAFGVPWAVAGGGAGGALVGQALGNAFAIGVVAWMLRDQLIGSGTGAATSGMRRKPDARTMGASWAFIAFALLSNLDVLMAKLWLSPHESGQYAALATIGKVVIFMPSAIAVVMVPGVARARASGTSAATVLRKTGPLVLATTLLVAVPILAFPSETLELMFGGKYTGASGGVRAIAVAGIGLALVYLLVVYTVAIQDPRWVLVLTGGVLVQVLAVLLRHGNPTDIATAQAGAVFLILLINEALFHPVLRTGRGIVAGR